MDDLPAPLPAALGQDVGVEIDVWMVDLDSNVSGRSPE
jgi:hypothetical protein